MKFLCDQCKAKYQIADEKVAGKTVRMKCRKCGHMIEVRAAVTETSVSIDMPKEDNPAAALAPAAGKGPAKPASAQKPGLSAGPAKAGGLATSLSAARPRASAPPPRPDGALAGAFQRTVRDGQREARSDNEEPSALDLLELSVTEEWYVAINGVPVGPVRVSELRRKAASGAVTEDSLVWQEGLEEWRPVRAIPELAALVREAAAGGRISLATPSPANVLPGASPGPARNVMPRQGSMPGTAPRPMAPVAPAIARNNVVPFTARSGHAPAALATAERLDEAEIIDSSPAPAAAISVPQQRVSIAADPFASFAAPPNAAQAQMGSGSFAAVQPQTGSLPIIATRPSAPPPAQEKKAPPWIAIAMVVLAGAFGVTAAIALFIRQPPPAAPAPVIVQAPAQPVAPQPVAIASTVAAPLDTAVATNVDAGGAKPGAIAMHGGTGGVKTAAPTSTGPKAADLGSLLGGNNGPSSGPTGGPAAGGGSSLTSDQVETTVRNHSLGVKRTCWEKIGDGKAGTVNINVTANVAGNGNVTSSTATGNDPMVAKCIEGAVRSWQFPPTGGTTTVNIPFKFVRQ